MISATSGETTCISLRPIRLATSSERRSVPDDVALQHGDEGRQPADAGPDACSRGGQPGHLGFGQTRGWRGPRRRCVAAVATLRTSEQPAEHGQVPNPALGRVVVEESHRTQSEVLDALQVASQRLARRPAPTIRVRSPMSASRAADNPRPGPNLRSHRARFLSAARLRTPRRPRHRSCSGRRAARECGRRPRRHRAGPPRARRSSTYQVSRCSGMKCTEVADARRARNRSISSSRGTAVPGQDPDGIQVPGVTSSPGRGGRLIDRQARERASYRAATSTRRAWSASKRAQLRPADGCLDVGTCSP